MKSKNSKIAFTLAMIAGALCLGAFFYKYLSRGETDYLFLAAGIFILATGYASYYHTTAG